MARADEICRDCLKTNRASYNYLNLCSTNMFYEFPDKAFQASDFPLLVCQKVTSAGTPWAINSNGDQMSRVAVQIDLYYPLNDFETVSSVKYYGNHLLKKLATDVFACLRAHIYDTSGVFRYTELADRKMGIEEINSQPVCRRTLEIDLLLKNAE